jgi:hypothetical protein
MRSYQTWIRGILEGPGSIRTFRVLDPEAADDTPREIEITMLPDTPQTGGSEAEPSGFQIDIRYTNAPGISLYTQQFPDRDSASKAMDDLARACAAVEAKITTGDFKAAREAMLGLMRVFKSSGANPPTNLTQGD